MEYCQLIKRPVLLHYHEQTLFGKVHNTQNDSGKTENGAKRSGRGNFYEGIQTMHIADFLLSPEY